MGNINRVPLGLLGITDAQTQGVSPDDLSRSVISTLDIRDHWLLNMARRNSDQLDTIIGVGNATPITVPDSEMWCLMGFSAQYNQQDAGVVYEGSLEVDFSRGAGYFTTVATLIPGGAATAANDLRFLAFVPDQFNVFLPSGCQLRSRVTRIAGGPPVAGISILTRAVYTVIRT